MNDIHINHNQRGFTLVELLSGLVIGLIVILTLGIISTISQRSYQKILRESNLYSDVAYGFKMMQNRVRTASSTSISTPGGVWQGDRLNISGQAFGICQADASATQNFVYMSTADANCTNPEVILSVASTDTLGLTFATAGTSITARISGSKSNMPFDMSTTIDRRAP